MVSIEQFQDYCRARYKITNMSPYWRYGIAHDFLTMTKLRYLLSGDIQYIKREIKRCSSSDGWLQELRVREQIYTELWNFLMYGYDGVNGIGCR